MPAILNADREYPCENGHFNCSSVDFWTLESVGKVYGGQCYNVLSAKLLPELEHPENNVSDGQ